MQNVIYDATGWADNRNLVRTAWRFMPY